MNKESKILKSLSLLLAFAMILSPLGQTIASALPEADDVYNEVENLNLVAEADDELQEEADVKEEEV